MQGLIRMILISEEKKMSGNRNESSESGGVGCAIMLCLLVIAMPFAGLYLAIKGENEGDQSIGIVLIVIGIVIWVAVLARMG